MGGCDRLMATPIPVSYTRMTNRVLVIWLAMLPLMLHTVVGDGVIPLTAVVSFVFLGALPLACSSLCCLLTCCCCRPPTIFIARPLHGQIAHRT